MSEKKEVIQALKNALLENATIEIRLHLASLLLEDDQAEDAFEQCCHILKEAPDNRESVELARRSCMALNRKEQATRYSNVLEALDLFVAQKEEREKERALIEGNIISLHGDKDEGTVISEVERPAITLQDVAGMEDVKRRLKLAFLGPLQNPELRKLYGASLTGGMLLWGPPGCGKTFFARAIAGELGAKFISVGLDDVLGMYIGESERNIHCIFESARKNAPCVLFFDEVDALGQRRSHLRGSAGRNLVVQLLTELDNVSKSNEGVFVLGATNLPWDVDTALRRPGRFDRTLLVLPPDERARVSILRSALKDKPTEGINYEILAKRTVNFSGADIVHLANSAVEFALMDSIETGEVRSVNQKDLENAFSEIEESTSSWLYIAQNYAEFAKDGGKYDQLLDYIRDMQ